MKVLIIMFLACATAVLAGRGVPLWNGDMPGVGTDMPEEVLPDRGDGVTRLTNVSNPQLDLFLLEGEHEPAPFVIVCPGGGYSILAYNKEGTEIAEWLNSIGISGAVLKYRVPKNREGALEDARKSIRMAREFFKDWNIDPERIGMLGFSAGGHLTAACSTSADRPDFSVLIYPAYLFKSGDIELSDDILVNSATPPAFLVQTKDDKKYYRSTLAYLVALDAAGVEVEAHLFAKGGHGYGMRPSDHPVSQWPRLCEAWMREMKFLK
ncbi:alpha/beta hydrolase [Pontiellaceae bacterium B12219]|nr:alpha/beta hydrolase [Pontiellaceae bacterium B12219]